MKINKCVVRSGAHILLLVALLHAGLCTSEARPETGLTTASPATGLATTSPTSTVTSGTTSAADTGTNSLEVGNSLIEGLVEIISKSSASGINIDGIIFEAMYIFDKRVLGKDGEVVGKLKVSAEVHPDGGGRPMKDECFHRIIMLKYTTTTSTICTCRLIIIAENLTGVSMIFDMNDYVKIFITTESSQNGGDSEIIVIGQIFKSEEVLESVLFDAVKIKSEGSGVIIGMSYKSGTLTSVQRWVISEEETSSKTKTKTETNSKTKTEAKTRTRTRIAEGKVIVNGKAYDRLIIISTTTKTNIKNQLVVIRRRSTGEFKTTVYRRVIIMRQGGTAGGNGQIVFYGESVSGESNVIDISNYNSITITTENSITGGTGTNGGIITIGEDVGQVSSVVGTVYKNIIIEQDFRNISTIQTGEIVITGEWDTSSCGQRKSEHFVITATQKSTTTSSTTKQSSTSTSTTARQSNTKTSSNASQRSTTSSSAAKQSGTSTSTTARQSNTKTSSNASQRRTTSSSAAKQSGISTWMTARQRGTITSSAARKSSSTASSSAKQSGTSTWMTARQRGTITSSNARESSSTASSRAKQSSTTASSTLQGWRNAATRRNVLGSMMNGKLASLIGGGGTVNILHSFAEMTDSSGTRTGHSRRGGYFIGYNDDNDSHEMEDNSDTLTGHPRGGNAGYKLADSSGTSNRNLRRGDDLSSNNGDNDDDDNDDDVADDDGDDE